MSTVRKTELLFKMERFILARFMFIADYVMRA
jgi:hypothetical protein